jgi:4-amino-4-deoxy-L-arabinose transferase-like glycosyltransferase
LAARVASCAELVASFAVADRVQRLNPPNPALVSQREAEPLPRLALLVLCAAYVLPGLFGRDPWKSADITLFGYVVNIASGKTGWLAPTVGGVPADGALLPYWIGAVFVRLLSPMLDPIIAARIPFALLLALALALTWYAAYHLARSESAQPLPFAFGGEAAPVDYARAIADGAVLALIASVGLLQLGHETTPELVQLAAVALYLYGLAAGATKPAQGSSLAALAIVVLAASGGPTIAMLLVAVGVATAWRSPTPVRRTTLAWLALGTVLAVVIATALGAWAMRLGSLASSSQVFGLARQIAWFAWPAWLLALWTLWQWRHRLASWHIVVPLAVTLTLLAAWLAMAGSDRALMLSLPALAVLAAFALPTLERSAAAAIDWFSVFFFTIAVATGWVFYVAMQTGTPASLARNVAKLSPGYANAFSWPELALAIAGTVAWLWLVRWRTGRNRHPLWKSLVLPAGGVSVCFLLVMTLLLPPLDNARSYRAMMQRMTQLVPAGSCIAAPGMARAQVVALEYFGRYRVDASAGAASSGCEYLMLTRAHKPPAAPWVFVARERRNRADDDITDIYRRSVAG